MQKEVRVFAPASVANVAVGYDILGFALEGPGDEIRARIVEEPGLRIQKIRGDQGRLPLAINKNTAGYAAWKVLEHLGETDRGIELEIIKHMPFGSGLGSSAASAAAGAMVVNELLGAPLEKSQLLHAAVCGEQVADGAFHADNVAPSLLGGFVLIRDNETLDVVSLPSPDSLHASVVHPEIQVLTRDARTILEPSVTLSSLIRQTGNLASFVAALYRSDVDLLSRSLKDVVIEPQRAPLIPGFYAVQKAALERGALGCSISGAGPSIFALSTCEKIARQVGEGMQKVFRDNKVESQLFVSPINQKGAYRI